MEITTVANDSGRMIATRISITAPKSRHRLQLLQRTNGLRTLRKNLNSGNLHRQHHRRHRRRRRRTSPSCF
eukprot:438350-Pleurochrysis_carterae.AAC.1